MRIAGLLRNGRSERELRAEIESHLQLHIDDNLRAGMTPAEARRAALLKFGRVETIKDEYRARRSIPHVDTLLQDLRYAVRRWAHRPGFGKPIMLGSASWTERYTRTVVGVLRERCNCES